MQRRSKNSPRNSENTMATAFASGVPMCSKAWAAYLRVLNGPNAQRSPSAWAASSLAEPWEMVERKIVWADAQIWGMGVRNCCNPRSCC